MKRAFIKQKFKFDAFPGGWRGWAFQIVRRSHPPGNATFSCLKIAIFSPIPIHDFERGMEFYFTNFIVDPHLLLWDSVQFPLRCEHYH